MVFGCLDGRIGKLDQFKKVNEAVQRREEKNKSNHSKWFLIIDLKDF